MQLVVTLPLYANPPMVTELQTIAKFGLVLCLHLLHTALEGWECLQKDSLQCHAQTQIISCRRPE